ncbi:MAG: hypothetical protein KGI70_03245, partial [Patescibacteria group bacterium]|nr:hypothetical protein [Patescibacteria group bacterium]
EALDQTWRSLGEIMLAVDNPIAAWTLLCKLREEKLVQFQYHPYRFRLTREGLDEKEHPGLRKKRLPASLTRLLKNPRASVR